MMFPPSGWHTAQCCLNSASPLFPAAARPEKISTPAAQPANTNTPAMIAFFISSVSFRKLHEDFKLTRFSLIPRSVIDCEIVDNFFGVFRRDRCAVHLYHLVDRRRPLGL